jgi:hypothetical protein
MALPPDEAIAGWAYGNDIRYRRSCCSVPGTDKEGRKSDGG